VILKNHDRPYSADCRCRIGPRILRIQTPWNLSRDVHVRLPSSNDGRRPLLCHDKDWGSQCHELQRKGAVSDQLADQIRTLYQVRQSLKLLLIYYFFGFAYLVFLLFLRDILDLAKDRHHTPT